MLPCCTTALTLKVAIGIVLRRQQLLKLGTKQVHVWSHVKHLIGLVPVRGEMWEIEGRAPKKQAQGKPPQAR